MMDDARDTTVVMEGATACLHAPCPAAWGWALQCETSQRRGSRDAYKGTGENSQAQHQLQRKAGGANKLCIADTIVSTLKLWSSTLLTLGAVVVDSHVESPGMGSHSQASQQRGRGVRVQHTVIVVVCTTQPSKHEARRCKCADT